MKPITLTRSNFTAETASGLTLVDFWASWCGPCRMIAPVIDELAEEITDVKFGKVNVDEEPYLSDAFSIEVIPTLVLMKDGRPVDRVSGVKQKKDLLTMIERKR